MSPRTGRPKSDKPLIVEVKARIDVETNDKLVEYCKKNDMTRTEVVRKGIEMVLDAKNRVLPDYQSKQHSTSKTDCSI